MGGYVLLFKQQNRISCESPTCNTGERQAAVGAWPTRGDPGFKRHRVAFACLNKKAFSFKIHHKDPSGFQKSKTQPLLLTRPSESQFDSHLMSTCGRPEHVEIKGTDPVPDCLGLPLVTCVTLGMLLNLSDSYYPHL